MAAMRIAFVTPAPLAAGRSASQHRALALVGALREAGAAVSTAWTRDDRGEAGPGSGRRLSAPDDLGDAEALVVSDVWLPEETAGAIAAARAARTRGLPIAYDAVDFLAGAYLGVAGPETIGALRSAEAELRRLADALLYVTRVEAAKAEALHGPARGAVLVVPSCHPALASPPGHGARRNVCFLGSGNPHNAAALTAFAETVLPLLLRSDPSVEFHVLGAELAGARLGGPPELLSRVRVLGPVDDVLAALSGYRALACPMVSGSGLKGKILDAMAAGTPDVATVPSVEGMRCVQGDSILLAELGPGFARALLALDRDARLWARISAGGLELVGESYGPAEMAANARRLLEALRAGPRG
jgi:glycosyltransferase involved in cell wall biosynthesis